jgi:hypothetical protein
MPLNLHVSDGDSVPFLKYNAKAGRWYVRTDSQEGDVEIINPVLAFDFANIRTGWLFYAEGMAPEKIWDASPNVISPKPLGPKAFKRGFEVMVHGQGEIGLREFSSTANNAIGAIVDMYNAVYEPGITANPGKIPVFACTGVKQITGKYGTNYSPIFKLQSWQPRSAFPFDRHGDAYEPPASTGKVWTWKECVDECTLAGISVDDAKAHLKANGVPGYNAQTAARCSELVRQLLESSKLPASFDPPPSDEDVSF